MKMLLKLSFIFLAIGMIVSCKPKGEKAATGDAADVASAMGKAYTVDVANSTIMWEGVKVTGKHNGTINVSEGSVAFDKGTLSGGSFVIDMNSLKDLDMPENKRANLENHLKGTAEGKETDFFNTPVYPTAKFEITKATKLMNNEDANYVVSGNLTLKDMTKEISFRAQVDEAEGGVNVSTPAFTINRTDWGIKFRSAKFIEGLGDKAIKDEIGLQIKLRAM